ncbi:MAG: ABC transporter permease [Candidatus Heimdallarchaeota archaeon]
MSIQNVKRGMGSFSRVLGKGIWRDFINIGRYKVALFGWLFSMLVGIGSAFIFGVVFQFNPITSAESGIQSDQVFVFFAGGIALSTFVDTAFWAPMGRVEQDIHYGTLEAVFVSPANRLAYLLSPTIADSILNLIFFIPAFVVIMVANGSITDIYVLGTTMLVVLLTIVSMITFGVFFAMIAILVRRSRPLAVFLSMLFQFFCGAYVPVQSYVALNRTLGEVLKYIAAIFPYTHCYDLFRYFTYGDTYNPLFPIWLEFLFLGVTSVLFLGVAALLLKSVEKKAKKDGLSIL